MSTTTQARRKDTGRPGIVRKALDSDVSTEESTQGTRPPPAPAEGLSAAEAARRLAEHGYNELVERRRHPVWRLLGYFNGPIPWMIEAAALLSAGVRDWTDFSIILALLGLNAAVGFFEEFQADNAIAALKEKLALEARVKRDGAWGVMAARELVPGDLVRLRLGDVVPADVTLLRGGPIDVDQAALTGESLPVSRGPGESAYAGSSVKRGETDALVTATGSGTYFGKTAALVEGERTPSHFQRAVLKVGRYLIGLALVLVTVILVTALLRQESVLTALRFALVLTVAAIPVAMPTVLSVTMAVGARLLARKQAVVRRLASIEELAGIDVLCSDKTGTLTQNRLTLAEPFTLPGITREEIVLQAALASETDGEDPIDHAILEALGDRQVLDRYRIDGFQPFDPVSKRAEAAVSGPDGTSFRVSKGAPQVIRALARNPAGAREAIEEAVERFAAKGYRSLGVARRQGTEDWTILGLLPLHDPPREDSLATVREARRLGLDVKIVTGDQSAIAKETARQLGLGTNILSAEALDGKRLEKADGFAEVYPEHKYRIVEFLQKHGHFVGMTGDGVNDAPALTRADAGIAVSGATDAARAAADIVLMTPGLSVIVDAIRESRKIFQRMNSYTLYRIAETVRVLFFMATSILVFRFYPVTAVMIVLLALLNDGAILSIAYDRVQGSDGPERWNMPVVLGVSTLLGLGGVLESFLLLYLGDRVLHLPRETLQTLIYLKLSVAGHFTVFVTRTRGPFWSSRPGTGLLAAVIGTQITATLLAVYGGFMTPLGWTWALAVWGYCLLGFLVEDRVKLLAYRLFDRRRPGDPGTVRGESRALA